jgi:leader peptidase (prepilin peptidase) / N-methyltransferase
LIMNVLLPVLFAGYVFDFELDRWLRPVRYPCTAFLSAFSYVILYYAFHDYLLIVKGIVFIQLMILAGYIDFVKHEIPNVICVLIFLDGLILINPPQAVIGFFAVSLPMLLLGVFFKGSVGGGDIKLMAACGVVLGPFGALAGTIISCAVLFFSVFVRYARSRKFTRMNAMAPYFGIGCSIAYLLEFKG